MCAACLYGAALLRGLAYGDKVTLFVIIAGRFKVHEEGLYIEMPIAAAPHELWAYVLVRLAAWCETLQVHGFLLPSSIGTPQLVYSDWTYSMFFVIAPTIPYRL